MVDLAEVFVDGLAGVFGHAAQLDFQPHARKRRAQVVRNAGQHELAVGLGLAQVFGHAVERGVQVADFERPLFGQGGGRFTARQDLGGPGQAR